MSRLSRRSFLAASAALVAAPALGAVSARARSTWSLSAPAPPGSRPRAAWPPANRRFALIEAADRIGGRCATDTKIFGVPYDLGAHWIRTCPTAIRWLGLGPTGLDIYPAPPRPDRCASAARNARDGELEEFLAAPWCARTARSRKPARAKADVAAAQALPQGSRRLAGDDRIHARAVRLRQGSQGCLGDGSCPRRSSATSMRSAGRAMARCWRSSPPTCRRCSCRRRSRASNGAASASRSRPRKAALSARAVIVTVSTNVLAADKIEFEPGAAQAPARCRGQARARQLRPYRAGDAGQSARSAARRPGVRAIERAAHRRVARQCIRHAAASDRGRGTIRPRACRARARPRWSSSRATGSPSCSAPNVKKAIKRSHATRWNDEPCVLGAMSAATPGNADARRILMEPIGGRIWFAGEAVHETQWGTVNGAWESGERAAEAALAQVGALKDPADASRRSAPPRAPGEDDR